MSFRLPENECIEDIIDADRPIIDAHHHLWDIPGRKYLFREFCEDVNSGHNIIGTVHVEVNAMYRKDAPQNLKSIGETEFVRGVAAMAASGNYGPAKIAHAIVGFVDLASGAFVAEALDAHILAAGGRFRGIRDGGTWDADPSVRRGAWMPDQGRYLDAKFRAGFKELEKRNLSFDAWVYHTQLADLYNLARTFPKTPIILNHMSGILGRGDYAHNRVSVIKTWQDSMKKLSECPNVYIKLGGMGMWSAGFGFEDLPKAPSSETVAEAFASYIHFCIEHFGADRCMFESNFPADKTAYGYPIIWNAFKRIAKGYNEDEKTNLFKETANRVYRLNL